MPLQLDPRHPPLWRGPTTVQFGADPVAVVEADQPWHARLITALANGLPTDGLAPFAASLGASAPDAESFVRQIAPALHTAAPAARAVLRISGAVDETSYATVYDAVESTGVELTDAADAPLVVLASHVLDPRATARLMAEDRTHLPVVFTTAGVDVGPLVVPGRTACMACVAVAQRESDPWWPAVAAQLIGASPPACPTALAAEAGLTAARMLIGSAGSPEVGTLSWRFRPETLPRTKVHRPHADCGCRSPAGIATDRDHALRVPTTATATVVPA